MPLNNLKFMIFTFILNKNMKLSIFKIEIQVKINLSSLLDSGYLLNIKKLRFLKKHLSCFCIIPTLPVLTIQLKACGYFLHHSVKCLCKICRHAQGK